jgi:alpha-D-xyloside xylohydrolase
MIDELHRMGMKLMVSVWPNIEDNSENSSEMQDKDLVILANRGINYIMGSMHVMDATNPEAQKFI